MSKELDENQALAVSQLRPGSILCGGVGSGKSRTALAYYYNKICGGGLEVIEGKFTEPKRNIPLYIITTATKRDKLEWDDELSLYCLSKNEEVSIGGIKVVIDSWNNIKKYVDVKNAFFIFDEQRIIGSGQWVKSFYKISKNNKWILLSATPGDNWMDYIPVFVANGYYKNRTEFIARHVIYKPYRNFPVIDRYVDVQRLINIRSELLVNIKYTQKAKHDIRKIQCGYNKDEYNYILRERKDPIEKCPIRNISEFSYKIKRSIYSSDDRIKKCVECLKANPRVIIFYNFDYELEILRDICSKLKVTFAEHNGHKHEDVPDAKEWVYLVQYNSGSEAWNCITTNVILFYSPSPSYKQMKQASGRIDRRNTPFNILKYLYLQSSCPVEMRIYKAIGEKKKFNDSALADLWYS